MSMNYGPLQIQELSYRIGLAVASTAELAAIPPDRRAHDMLILAAGALYRFDFNSVATGAGIVVPDVGPGRWIGAAQAQAAAYTNATRPLASTLPAGGFIWNTDDNALNFSDGTNWRDATGALT